MFVAMLLLVVACGSNGNTEARSDGGADATLDVASRDSGHRHDAPPPLGGKDGSSSKMDSASSPDAADGASGGGCVVPASLTLAPSNKVAAVTAGTSFSLAYTVTANYTGHPAAHVTTASFFTLSDPGVGSFSNNVFHWGEVYGGVFTVRAQYCGVVGTTSLTLQLSAAIETNPGDAGTDGGELDAGGAESSFKNAPASLNASCAPTLVYPPDGTLLPPNTNVIEVHFLEGTPRNTLFEVSFENAVTDVRIYTTCTGTMVGQGMPLNGGCVFELSQSEWDFIAKTNRNGDPLTVQVRGLGCDGGNVASSATRQLSFAQEDMLGTLYYWASMRAIVVAGQTVNSGGIFRYDFGVRGQSPDPVLTPSSKANPTGLCIGCHTISRDGRQMVFDFDDNDDDDEYGDVRTDVYDIAAQKPAVPIVKNGNSTFAPGYHTWDRTTTQFLLSDGPGNTATPKGTFTLVSPTGTVFGYVPPGNLRGTTPDWAPDNSSVVFAVPPNANANPPNGAGYWQNGRDQWFAGASLYTAPWNPSTATLGAPTLLIASTGDNFYYPSYSPDGSLLVFNHATSGANFHNALARVQLVASGQASPTPDDLGKLNDVGNLTNSWARWSPFVQDYKGGKLLWLTMSSTRNYGLRIVNTGNQNCYPTESPLQPAFNNTSNCNRAQLWMAAIRLDPGAVQQGQDVSWPAFWLPFQDLGTNNHLAQWAQEAFTGACAMPDAGPSHDAGGSDASACAPGLCCNNGGCAPCPTPPVSGPTCAATSNCSPGQCCVAGSCAACPAPDGGSSPDGGASPDGGTHQQGCNTCLDCDNQACLSGACGACTNSSQCCAPLECVNGVCVTVTPK